MPSLDVATSELVLRALAEPTRLRLFHLCARGEHTVSDLVAVLQQSQPRVSRHLKILCDSGLLERFRDGHWVYFRVPLQGEQALTAAYLLAMTDASDAVLVRDTERLDVLLGEQQHAQADPTLRRFNRLIIDSFLSHPVGDLLDVGVGSGAILKLLASKATHATGIDTDSASRRAARRSFARASLANCTVRDGDMYQLPFDDALFDTVVLDEILLEAEHPMRVISEAVRAARPTGRLLLVEHVPFAQASDAGHRLTALLADADLRCGPIRQTNDGQFKFLVAMVSIQSAQSRKRA